MDQTSDISIQTSDIRGLDAIILAAGKGTRMNSDLPKVLHEVAGRPMVQWVVDACRAAGAGRCIVVVGYKQERVREALAGQDDVVFVEQLEQLGTGHAAMMARPAFDSLDSSGPERDVLVLAGDMPLLRAESLEALVEHHRTIRSSGTLASGKLEDPTGYGRVVRDERGAFRAIVEHKDATDAQRTINEVNPSCYCFDAAAMFEALDSVSTDNAQGEYYITDVLGLLRAAGKTVDAVPIIGSDEAEGINNPEQLAAVDAMLRQRQEALSR